MKNQKQQGKNPNNQSASSKKGSSQNQSFDNEGTKSNSRQVSHAQPVDDEDEEFQASGSSRKIDKNLDQSAGSRGRSGGTSQDQSSRGNRSSRNIEDVEDENLENPAPSRQGSKNKSQSSQK